MPLYSPTHDNLKSTLVNPGMQTQSSIEVEPVGEILFSGQEVQPVLPANS